MALVCLMVLLCLINSIKSLVTRVTPRMSVNVQQGDVPAKTKNIFDLLKQKEEQVGGAGGSSSLQGLLSMNSGWEKLKAGGWAQIPATIVSEMSPGKEAPASKADDGPVYDVVVCGGTLGVFHAIALQAMGYKTAICERGLVAGRSQEWNISRREMGALARLGIVSEEEIEGVIGIEFNPVRIGFKTDTRTGAEPGFETFTENVLNIGVRPDRLIELVKKRYMQRGGVIHEKTALTGIDVYDDIAVMRVDGGDVNELRTRLVLDAMGNQSPIAKQIRGAIEPDGICIVVGTCARGFDQGNNTYSDLIYTDTPVVSVADDKSQQQYFWEAFPAGSGAEDRTTYLFTYMDAKPERPSILEIMEDYWELLPRYQGKSIDELEVLRILFGCFPTYRSSPLQTSFNRVLQVGDASGIQSPLSFGGFGSLTRHLERLVGALDECLSAKAADALLSREALARLNPYQPNLSACWMFQRAMSVPIGRNPKPDLVTGTLSNSFSAMESLGDETMRPFLQDVLMFKPLLRTLLLAGKQDLLTPFKIVPHVGIAAMVDFVRHFFNMGLYTFLATYVGPAYLKVAEKMNARNRFLARRYVEEWKFGSGLDYYDHE